MASDGIHGARPAFPGDRLARLGKARAVDDLGGAKRLQILGLVEPAGPRDPPGAKVRQERDSSEERRVGTESVRLCKSRWRPYTKKKKKRKRQHHHITR